MDMDGYSWISMDIHGYSCIHGYSLLIQILYCFLDAYSLLIQNLPCLFTDYSLLIRCLLNIRFPKKGFHNRQYKAGCPFRWVLAMLRVASGGGHLASSGPARPTSELHEDQDPGVCLRDFVCPTSMLHNLMCYHLTRRPSSSLRTFKR